MSNTPNGFGKRRGPELVPPAPKPVTRWRIILADGSQEFHLGRGWQVFQGGELVIHNEDAGPVVVMFATGAWTRMDVAPDEAAEG